MMVLACVLGLRIGDIKNLRFKNFNWEEKKLSIIQHKTHKPLSLPIPDAVGCAVIDYIKNGRPHYYESDVIFLKHMPPFDPISDENHMQQQIIRCMRKAGIDQRSKKHSGFHSLRHSAGSMLLEMETPLPVIGYITVHEAKNHKERIVPIHPLLTDRCLELKEKIHAASPEDEYFFMMGPRVHDFRHTYCVNLLRKWTDEGKDLMAYLPYMRTMLGHEGFEETAYYLKLTTERFPYIKEQLKISFSDLIKEVFINEHEFY